MDRPTWDEANCPPAIASLPDDIQDEALTFANRAREAGRHPDRAISFGIAKALAARGAVLGEHPTTIYVIGECTHRWVITSDDSDVHYTFDEYEDALRRGQELARARGLPMVALSSKGGVLERYDHDDAGDPRPGA
jgi:hypothetical protein